MENTEKLYEFLDDDFDIRDIETFKKWYLALREFEQSDAKKMRFTLKNAKEKNNCRSAIGSYLKRNGKDWTVICESHTYNIYIVRS